MNYVEPSDLVGMEGGWIVSSLKRLMVSFLNVLECCLLELTGQISGTWHTLYNIFSFINLTVCHTMFTIRGDSR